MEEVRRELGFAEMILRKGKPKKKKAPVIKRSDVERNLLFEIEMREAAQRLLNACSNPQQRLDAAKTILTSNNRTLALMTALQKEHVKEVEEACGLTDLKDREDIIKEDMLETISLADVTISNIIIPLKWCKIDPAKYKSDCWKYHVFCLVRSGVQVQDSKHFAKVDLLAESIVFEDMFVLSNLRPDFVIDLEVYYAQNDELSKHKKSKKSDHSDGNPVTFAIGATATLTLAHCNIWQQKQSLKTGNIGAPAHITAPSTLPDIPPLPVLNFYRAQIDVRPHFTMKPSKEGFLDVQHMSGGMPHWIRSWCCLQGMFLKAWKQPEDQYVSEPTEIIEINEHMILDHVARASVQRPHSIHISYSKSPYTDHFLSTDTKEERILWEIVLHKAMLNSSTWHPNKLSCSDNAGTSPSPLRSAPPKPPRPVTGPQFSYTPSNPCLPAYRAQYEASRNARLDRLMDRTPTKTRSKSVEKKKTPQKAEHRARSNTCKKPNRRRSRSVELTPQRSCDTPRQRDTPRPCRTPQKTRDCPGNSADTPKRDRVSDATYVSMHKFSRLPLTVDMPKPNRPAPRPPSLSKLPDSIPSRSPQQPLTTVNESYRTALKDDGGSPSKRAPPRPRRSPRLPKVSEQSRRKKGVAPTPGGAVPTPSPNKTPRSKKSPAPTPKRRTPRQSEGGTNDLNSPVRSNKKKAGVMNVVNELDSYEDLSPSITKSSNSSTSPSCLTLDFENMIDEAFGSLYDENTALSSNTTPSFHPAGYSATPSGHSITPSGRSASPSGHSDTPYTKKVNKVARNTPLTSTMKENAVPFTSPGNITGITPMRCGSELANVKESFAIEPIRETVEEERGDSILEGYFDSSTSTINSDKENETENETPQNMSDLSPIYSLKKPAVSFKRRSASPNPLESPPKRPVTKPKPERSPLSRASPRKLQKTPEKSPLKLNRVSPRQMKKAPSAVSAKKALFEGEAASTRPKPKFQVVNGKLVPMT